MDAKLTWYGRPVEELTKEELVEALTDFYEFWLRSEKNRVEEKRLMDMVHGHREVAR